MTQEKALKVLQSGKNVFLTGEPGSGKTYTVNLFRDWLRSRGKKYAVTASTGIAATHIGGVTIHSWSGLGIKENILQKDIDNIIYNKPFVVNKINDTDVLIIDEISMLDANTIENVDLILRGVRGSQEAFGGIQVVFVGDFFQLPPVSRDRKAKFAFESESWKVADLVCCYLHEQHRQSDPIFLQILTAMRNGEVKAVHKKILKDTKKNSKNVETQLFTHNADVDRINNSRLQEIEGEEVEYFMTSSGNEYLITMLKKTCLSPEKLVLKVGAAVMFTRNKYDEERTVYVNGTLGEVVGFDNDMPVVRTFDGDTIYLEEMAEWSIEGNYGGKAAAIQQIPLKLAWAITVHKSQGMSLDAARIDLSKAFERGQGYVAISRVRSLQGLCIEGINDMALELHPRVIEEDEIFREQSDLVDADY